MTVLLIAVVIAFVLLKKALEPIFFNANTIPVSAANEQGIIELTGRMTDFNTSCIVDAACTATVNGYTIVVNPGMVQHPVEVGQSDVGKEDIGKTVSVRALKIGPRDLTIVGSKDYYVLKVTNP